MGFEVIPLTQGKVALIDRSDLRFVCRHRWHAVRIGKYWYARTSFVDAFGRRRRVTMHRLLTDAQPGELVEHIDGDGLNNQRHNFRHHKPQPIEEAA